MILLTSAHHLLRPPRRIGSPAHRGERSLLPWGLISRINPIGSHRDRRGFGIA